MGILLHSRWAHALFRPVSERLCVLDVKLTNEMVSIFCVYMPHADYPDEDVDVVYAQLDLEVARSKNRKPRLSLPVIGMRGWDMHRMMMMINLSVRQILDTEVKGERNSSNGALCMATW